MDLSKYDSKPDYSVDRNTIEIERRLYGKVLSKEARTAVQHNDEKIAAIILTALVMTPLGYFWHNLTEASRTSAPPAAQIAPQSPEEIHLSAQIAEEANEVAYNLATVQGINDGVEKEKYLAAIDVEQAQLDKDTSQYDTYMQAVNAENSWLAKVSGDTAAVGKELQAAELAPAGVERNGLIAKAIAEQRQENGDMSKYYQYKLAENNAPYTGNAK